MEPPNKKLQARNLLIAMMAISAMGPGYALDEEEALDAWDEMRKEYTKEKAAAQESDGQ